MEQEAMTGQPPRGASGSYTGGGQPRHVEAVHEGATQLPFLPASWGVGPGTWSQPACVAGVAAQLLLLVQG